MAAFLLLAVMVFCIIYVVSGLRSNAVQIRAFEIPAQAEQFGVTSLMLARRIGDEIQRMKSGSWSFNTRVSAAFVPEEKKLDIEIPETNLTLNTVSQLIRQTVGLQETTVSGELRCPNIKCERGEAVLAIRISSNGALIFSQSFPVEQGDIDQTIQRAAERIVVISDPYLAAVYHTGQMRFRRANEILDPLLVGDSSDDRKWARYLAGLICEQTINKDVCDPERHYREALAIDNQFTPALGALGSYLTTICAEPSSETNKVPGKCDVLLRVAADLFDTVHRR